MSLNTGIREGIYRSSLVRAVTQWLDVTPHPLIACEIATDYIAAARWTRGLGLEAFAVEQLPPGAIVPSAVETNIMMLPEVRSAVGRVLSRLRAKGQIVALLIPDPVVPVFVLHFDVFPRRLAEAEPLLRWRLKKSTPFEAEETIISFMRQAPRDEGVDIVTGLARLRIIREYEQLDAVGWLDSGRGAQFYPGSAALARRPPLHPAGPRRRTIADHGDCSRGILLELSLHRTAGGITRDCRRRICSTKSIPSPRIIRTPGKKTSLPFVWRGWGPARRNFADLSNAN